MRDWENLRYFLAVAEQGTVLGAANKLGVSHSTVLRRIEQFEQALGSRLFKKLQRGYELTLAGERLFEQAQSLEAQIESVLARAEGQSDGAEGTLRISQPEMGIINVYPLYAAFRRLHPEITLEVHSTMAQHNITQQEVDIVLRISESPPDLLAGRCLGKVKGKAYASKGYLAKQTPGHTPADYDWIFWAMTAEGNRHFLARNQVLEPNVVLHADSMPDVVSAVTNGMGAGFLSTQQAQLLPNLVELFDGQVVAEYSIWMLTHRDLRNSVRVKTFMRFMAEHMVLD